jgi:pimeloyl-ACP methyl ester carboxylesterase
MQAFWISLAICGLAAGLAYLRTSYIIRKYGPPIRRIFEESPIFSPTEGVPHPTAEAVEFPTADELRLRGSYLRAPTQKPKGLIVFCHEFRSDRWSGVTYWEFLHKDGFDIFAFDFRNHGESDKDPAYEPRHWVTGYELADLQAAIDYLKTRPDARHLPVGLFGISRGGGAAIGVSARDRSIRCVVTDGAFGTHGTVLTYMMKWMTLVVGDKWYYRILPRWHIALVRDRVLAGVERDLGFRFIRLERAIRRLAPRPLLMIHGGRDSYIRPDIARDFFECAGEPRELWIVPGARHNVCLETAGDEYRQRVLEFFRAHLAGEEQRSGNPQTGEQGRRGDAETRRRGDVERGGKDKQGERKQAAS